MQKWSKMNSWESFYIQMFQQDPLIYEQSAPDLNPLYTPKQYMDR
jgi:hypothetical protein